MQKVAKELLAAVESKQITYPVIDVLTASAWPINDMDTLIKLVRLREILLLNQLGKNMKTKLGKGATIFDVWMKEESDLIQATSKAYGYRVCLEGILSVIAKEDDKGITYVYFIYKLGIFYLKSPICMLFLWWWMSPRGILPMVLFRWKLDVSCLIYIVDLLKRWYLNLLIWLKPLELSLGWFSHLLEMIGQSITLKIIVVS
jgi:hypothetical protein